MLQRLALLLFLLPSTLLATAKPVIYIWDLSELDSLRRLPSSGAYRSYLQRADRAIQKGLVAVTDKAKTLSGDKHNYESLSVYWWPDPKNPNGPYIARDGEYNPEYKLYDYPRLQQLVDNIRSCAKAYYLSGDLKYYTFVCQQLDTWFINAQTRMNPDFSYCQFIPGRNGGRGNPQGMADVYNFNEIIEGVRLTNSVKSVGRSRMRGLKKWFGAFANWMQTSDYGKTASNFKNGQTLTYDTTLYDFMLFTGKKSARKAIFNHFYEKRISKQIEDDGKMPEALRRTCAYRYSLTNLQRFLDFWAITQADGRQLPQEGIDLITKALTYVGKFQGNRSAFPYSEIGEWEPLEKQLVKLQAQFRRLSKAP